MWISNRPAGIMKMTKMMKTIIMTKLMITSLTNLNLSKNFYIKNVFIQGQPQLSLRTKTITPLFNNISLFIPILLTKKYFVVSPNGGIFLLKYFFHHFSWIFFSFVFLFLFCLQKWASRGIWNNDQNWHIFERKQISHDDYPITFINNNILLKIFWHHRVRWS